MEKIIKVDSAKIALSAQQQKELSQKGYDAFDILEKQGVIHALECPTFMMSWSMASLHFDKMIGDNISKLKGESKSGPKK